MNKIFVLFLSLIILFACQPDRNIQDDNPFPELNGIYLGQELPGDTVRLFAPGIISTGMNERDASFVYNGKELFYTLFIENKFVILHTEEAAEHWTKPEVASFSGKYNDMEPCFASRGQGLYFISNRPVEGKSTDPMDYDIWYTYKTLEGWAEPQPIGAPVNTNQLEFFPSVTSDGTLYFGRNSADNSRSDIYRARWTDGKFNEPEKLPAIINAVENPFNACIAPDERYLVFCAYKRGSSYGGSDYYISYRDKDDTWSDPVNLGPSINTAGDEYSPHITPGGKYFFFATNGNPLQIKDPIKLVYSGSPPATFSYASLQELFLKMPVNGSMDIYWIETASFVK
ncbi:MAG: glycoside hydrolase [Methanosarcinaceae archaeon]|nr:glycoside hydrolase [Methanosarcinaceae archaeon]